MKIKELSAMVGKTEDEIYEQYAANMSIRVLRRDDLHFIGTNNHRMDRINLYLKDGIVVKASIC